MKFVAGVGPVPSDIMLIGEAPGKNEDEQGIPFIGTAGKILNEALELADIPRDTVYITNIYKYRPPNNRKPTPEEITAHWPYLSVELAEVQPKYILLLGATALEAFTGHTGISKWHGTRVMKHSAGFTFNKYVYATYHPAATIYNKTTKEAFVSDVKIFAKIAKSLYTMNV